MFVVLKIILFFVRPFIWAIVLFLFAAFTKRERRKRIYFVTGLSVLLIFSNPFLIRLLLHAYETPPVALSPGEQYEAGIVLGGFAGYNADDRKGYFNQASDRFLETAILYKKGHIRRIIIPAGNGSLSKNPFNEAAFARDRFLELGIPPEVIFTDSLSRNTIENAANTRKITDSIHLHGPYLLISSAMHLPRAAGLFKKQGLPVKLYPCDFQAKTPKSNVIEDYILPSAGALSMWDRLLVEFAGRLSNAITGKG